MWMCVVVAALGVIYSGHFKKLVPKQKGEKNYFLKEPHPKKIAQHRHSWQHHTTTKEKKAHTKH